MAQLSVTQEHHLKRELLHVQITRELNKLSPTYNDSFGLRRFGPPFKTYDPSKPPKFSKQELSSIQGSYIQYFNDEFPLLRMMFNEYFVTFPFIRHHLKSMKDQDTFWTKLQIFWELWKTKKISNSNDRGELSKRKLLLYKFQGFLLMFFNTGILCLGDDEYFSQSNEDRNTYKNVDKMMKGSKTGNNLQLNDINQLRSVDKFIDGLDINVAGVAVCEENKRGAFGFGRVTSTYYKFVIKVKEKSTGKEWYVRRRYSDFAKFDKEIFKLYPGNDLPYLPSKNKSGVDIDIDQDGSETESLSEKESMFKLDKDVLQSLNLSSSTSRDSVDSLEDDKLKFPREGLRVSLRGYLKTLATIKVIRFSPEFMEFLSKDPITPTRTESEDISLRSRLDHLLLVQHYRFQQETIKTITEMENSIDELKSEIYETGFGYIFEQLGKHDRVQDLPPTMKSLINLISIEIASTQYELFIGTDNSYENLKLFRRLHRLFPYAVVGTILRVTNPLQIVKKLIDLFTYQMPIGFGGQKAKSLLQVIFLSVLNEDLKKLEKERALLKDSIVRQNKDYLAVIHKIDEYFKSSDDTVLRIKKNCHFYNLDICFSVLLNNNNLKTKLNDQLLTQLIDEYKNDTESPDSLYHQANLYFKTEIRKLDKVSMKELWDSPELISIIKEILSIFFEPLIKLFQKANIHKYTPILKQYFEELITYFNSCHGTFSGWDMMVVKLVDIQWKYVPYSYEFMHDLYQLDQSSHEEEDRLFEGFVKWFNRFINFLNFMKTGNEGESFKVDLNKLIKETDDVNCNKLLKEINSIIEKIEKKKELYQSMMKRADSEELEKDYMKYIRNDKLNQNWDKINDKVFNLAASQMNSDSASGVSEFMGLSESNLTEMNIDMMEIHDEPKADIKKLTTLEFLRMLKQDDIDGHVESNAEFEKLDEFGEFEKLETSKLSNGFRSLLVTILKVYSGTKH